MATPAEAAAIDATGHRVLRHIGGTMSPEMVLPKLLADQHVRASNPLLLGKRFSVVRRPIPLVGVIGPWNFPVVLCFGDGLPALFAGAAVLLKPSEVTPLSVRELVRGWREEVGAPVVLDAVFGAGETGGALIDEVDYVQFTGSVATGRLIQAAASRQISAQSRSSLMHSAMAFISASARHASAHCSHVSAHSLHASMQSRCSWWLMIGSFEVPGRAPRMPRRDALAWRHARCSRRGRCETVRPSLR